MSATVFSLHADRPPVVQPQRWRGRYPQGVAYLPGVRLERARLVPDHRQRQELVAAAARCAAQAASLSIRLRMTDRDLAAEGRGWMEFARAELEAETKQLLESIAAIDRRVAKD
jgi:hypothetical protein